VKQVILIFVIPFIKYIIVLFSSHRTVKGFFYLVCITRVWNDCMHREKYKIRVMKFLYILVSGEIHCTAPTFDLYFTAWCFPISLLCQARVWVKFFLRKYLTSSHNLLKLSKH